MSTKHLIVEKLKDLLYANMVLERGLLVAPVVVMAYNLKNAAALALAFALITFVTVVFASFIPKKIPYAVRVIFNVVVAALMFIPAALAVDQIQPGLVYKLGIFLPLLITNSLVIQKSETRFRKIPTKRGMIIDLIGHIVGFAIVICLVGALRELFGSATLWGREVGSFQTAPALLLPFSGFLLIGMLAALVNWLKARRERSDR